MGRNLSGEVGCLSLSHFIQRRVLNLGGGDSSHQHEKNDSCRWLSSEEDSGLKLLSGRRLLNARDGCDAMHIVLGLPALSTSLDAPYSGCWFVWVPFRGAQLLPKHHTGTFVSYRILDSLWGPRGPALKC